jgi:tRNA(fMet)-specific endonuclease VapC
MFLLDTVFHYPVITFHEQMLGANAYVARAKSPRELVRGYAMLQQILEDFSSAQVLAFDDDAARIFQEPRTQRVRVGTMDLRIAAIALSRGFTLLTRNLVDFRRIPSLEVEDWTTVTGDD